MLATLLAAFVERPFVQRAGFESSPLQYSIRANILSWLVGVLIVYSLLLLKAESVFFVMYALAIPFSISIEGAYLRYVCLGQRHGHDQKARFLWRPILIGNLVSGVMLLIVLFAGLEAGDWLQRRGNPIVTILTEYTSWIHLTVLCCCSLVFFVDDVWPNEIVFEIVEKTRKGDPSVRALRCFKGD